MYRDPAGAECSTCGELFPLDELDVTDGGYVCRGCREKPFVDAAAVRCALCARVIDGAACAREKIARLCEACRASLPPSSAPRGGLIRSFDSFSRFWFAWGYLALVPPLALALDSLHDARFVERLPFVALLAAFAALFVVPAEMRRRARPDRIALYDRGLAVEKSGREFFFAWDELESFGLVDVSSWWLRREELRIQLRGWKPLRITALAMDDLAQLLAALHP